MTVVMFRRTGDADDRAASLKRELEELRSTLDSQGTRLSTLEGEIANSPETSDVAQEALDSVFTVESGSVQGSGFVVASQAGTSTVLTNYHVVASEWNSGGTVSLRRSDQTFFGTIVDVSIVEDLAAIEIPGIFPALPISLETSDVGSSVVVVGSPFGLDGTVVTGVLSSNRERELQFSAPISPGASGAPLMNEAGEVIGVVFSKVSGGGAEGLGFAVPMTHACRTVISCKQ